MKKCALVTIAFAALVCFNACTKQSEAPPFPLSDYFPLQTGKYITYDLDSLVFINFGSGDSLIHYQVQYYTDSTLTDNLGRTAYRIIRYIRKDSTGTWLADNSFMAVNTGTTIEWVEDNLRFIKLTEPFEAGLSWPGNNYIDASTSNSDVPYLNNWQYQYESDSMNVPFTVSGITIDSTIKVAEVNEGGGFNNPLIYSDSTYSSESYAKGIGLVYRHLLYLQYQPAINGIPAFFQGVGITLRMIDHN